MITWSSLHPSFGGGCRLHGRGCHTPWGYDPEHTDSPRPYTVAELEQRQEAPHFYAYASNEDYVRGFELWRAFRRDDLLNQAEADARLEALVDELRARGTPK